ncbi:MAG: YiiD C-terminal domain-containing protein [Pleurocapsa sp. MO_226.B13]|nr:YiiD C-terminal domain-containing protein [Pleurocapsa sp. MO_226.B13]
MVKQDCQTIQAYLYEHIPLSEAMDVQVIKVTNNLVILAAPIKPNINHRSTVFGGSATTLAILSAWTLVNFRLKSENINTRLVIQKNTMSYDKPITSDFEAVCYLTDRQLWQRFIKILQRKKKSRITVNSFLRCQGEQVGEFVGVFVALGI